MLRYDWLVIKQYGTSTLCSPGWCTSWKHAMQPSVDRSSPLPTHHMHSCFFRFKSGFRAFLLQHIIFLICSLINSCFTTPWLVNSFPISLCPSQCLICMPTAICALLIAVQKIFGWAATVWVMWTQWWLSSKYLLTRWVDGPAYST